MQKRYESYALLGVPRADTPLLHAPRDAGCKKQKYCGARILSLMLFLSLLPLRSVSAGGPAPPTTCQQRYLQTDVEGTRIWLLFARHAGMVICHIARPRPALRSP